MIKLPTDLMNRLNSLAKKLNKTPQYLFEKAIEEFIEDGEDCLLAESIIKQNNPNYSLEEVTKELELEDWEDWEDWEDCLLAESVLKKNNPRISIKEAMKKLELED